MSARPEQTTVRIWYAKGLSFHIYIGKPCDAEDVASIRLVCVGRLVRTHTKYLKRRRPTVQIRTPAPRDPPMKSLVLHVVLGWFFREAFKPHGLFRQDVYAFCSVFHFISILDGWLERGTHLFARFGAFNEPLRKVAHSHTRPLFGSGSLRAYQPREMTHTGT